MIDNLDLVNNTFMQVLHYLDLNYRVLLQMLDDLDLVNDVLI